MKPIEPYKDPRITNISFDNFTGSICIITPISDNDEDDDEVKGLMLSTSQTNGGADLFKPNHHVALMTQPVLGARSRKKNKTDSLANSRRSSLNVSPSLILPNNRIDKFHNEKKTSHHESSDSGLDFSLSTDSSIQYSQQQSHPTTHRPLSALNEDSSTDDGFHDQSVRFPVVINSLPNDQEKLAKSSNNDLSSEVHPLAPSSNHQHRSLNDLTNTIPQKAKKSSRKKTKLNIIIEPSVSLSSSRRFSNHDEHIHPVTRTPSAANRSITSNSFRTVNQQPKPKATTPLGHYPNPEQIRARINRSVIERQHPSYLPNPSRKGFKQQPIPFDPLSKVNHPFFRQQKQSNANIQDLHTTTSHQMKQILPDVYNEKTNAVDKWQEQTRIKGYKDTREILKIKQKSRSPQEHMNNFLTSTPRHEHDPVIGTNFKGPIIHQRQHPVNLTQRLKPNEPTFQNQSRAMNSNSEFATEYSPRNSIIPSQSHPKKLLPISNIENQTEHNHQLNQRHKSPSPFVNRFIRATPIQSMSINNFRRENNINRLSKIKLTQFNKEPKNSNQFFPTRSPIPWANISDQQIRHPPQFTSYQSSSSIEHNDSVDNKSTRTYPLMANDDQKPLDGRFVIPFNSQLPVYIDSSSQTSSHHTHPFTCTDRPNNINDTNVENSSREVHESKNNEERIDRRSCSSSSSFERFSPTNRFPLPLGKVTVAMENDDISTNYDSDDGWSNDSAELIYIDEQYVTQKKKNITSSSHFISQQSHSQYQVQQQNILLQ